MMPLLVGTRVADHVPLRLSSTSAGSDERTEAVLVRSWIMGGAQ